MIHSNRINGKASVYILAILLFAVTLSGARASAAEFSLAATIEFCNNLLHGNPSAGQTDLAGLNWIKVEGNMGKFDMALKADPKESKLFVRNLETTNLTVYAESDIEFISHLNQYFLSRPIVVMSRTEDDDKDETVVFNPSLVNGRIVLTADVQKIPNNFTVSTQFGSTQMKNPNDPKRKIIQMNHLPHLLLTWNSLIRIKIVPVDKGEVPPVEYLRYLQNDRVPVSLKEEFIHDVFAHILGYQYLAVKKEWAQVKSAINEAIRYADEHPNMNAEELHSYEDTLFYLFFGIEKATEALSDNDRDSLYDPAKLLRHLEKFKTALSELSK